MIRRYVIPLAFWVVVIFGCVFGVSHALHRAADAHDQKAAQLDVSATTQHKQGVASDAQVEAGKAQVAKDAAPLASDDASNAKLRGELARMRPAPSRPDPTPPTPGKNDPEPVSPPVDLAALVAKQGEYIASLEKTVADQKVALVDRDKLISSLTLSRDSYRNEAQDRAAAEIQLRAELAAKEGLIIAAELKGAAYGFAAGYATAKSNIVHF